MERMRNGAFTTESFEEYAEHSLTHDDLSASQTDAGTVSGATELATAQAGECEQTTRMAALYEIPQTCEWCAAEPERWTTDTLGYVICPECSQIN